MPRKVRRALTGTASVGQRAAQRKAAGIGANVGPDQPFRRGKNNRPLKPAEVAAPALFVLRQLTRPSSSIAQTAHDALTGKINDPLDVSKSMWKGAAENKRSWSQNLKEDLGVKGPTADVAGLALDIGLDPTTYVTLGVGSVANRAAQKAGVAAYRAAIKSGVKQAAAQKAAQKAAEAAAKAAPAGQGLKVKFAGREVPGIRRATARIAPRSLGRPGAAARNTLAEVNPRIRPAGITREQHEVVRAAGRRDRAIQGRGRDEGLQRGRAMNRVLNAEAIPGASPRARAKRVFRPSVPRGSASGDELHKRIIAEVEEGAAEHPVAKKYVEQRRKELVAERAAGVRTPDFNAKTGERGPARDVLDYIRRAEDGAAVGYYARQMLRPRHTKGRQMRAVEDTPLHAREDRLRLAVKDPAGEKYVTNIGLNEANRSAMSASLRANETQRAVFNMGKPFESAADLAVGDVGLYKLNRAGRLVKAEPGDAGARVIDEHLVDYAANATTVSGKKLRVWDEVQGRWKFVATATPGFNVRNLIGDTWNAYLAENPVRLAGSGRDAIRVLRRQGQHEKAMRRLEDAAPLPKGAKTVTVRGKYGGKEELTLDEIIREAMREGVLRSGQRGREIRDIIEGGEPLTKIGRDTRAGSALERLLQNREDLNRLGTYLSSRKRGLTPSEAAKRMTDYHPDYGDLSELEKTIGRRLAPFYTFTARNIPIQSRSLVKKPGKFANFEKTRNAIMDAQGIPRDSQSDLNEFDASQVPFIVNVGGKRQIVTAGLPQTDLQQFPLSALKGAANLVRGDLGAASEDFNNQLAEWAKKAASTIGPVKIPVELYANLNSFFRDEIERKESPLTPGPRLILQQIQRADPKLAAKLGITDKFIDRRTGKRTWAWRGRADYLSGQIPGAPQFVKQMMQESNRKGQGQGAKAFGFATGLRVRPFDKDYVTTKRINDSYELLDSLEKRQRALGQQGIGEGNRQYDALSARIAKEYRDIYQLSKVRGDAVLPKRGKPPMKKWVTRNGREVRTANGERIRTPEYQRYLDRQAKLRKGKKRIKSVPPAGWQGQPGAIPGGIPGDGGRPSNNIPGGIPGA